MQFVTVVTADMGASLSFYRDLLGYELARSGVLTESHSPVAGCRCAGRAFALLRLPLRDRPSCTVRLLEGADDAGLNRPRPAANILEPGLAALQLWTPDDAAAFYRLRSAGIETLSWPQYYHLDQVLADNRWQFGHIEMKTFSAVGPAGELLIVQRGLSEAGNSWPKWPEPDCRFAWGCAVLATNDRWPLLDFYRELTGARSGAARYLQQDTVNVATGAPPGSYFHYGRLEDGVEVEWRESRVQQPSSQPPWPTSLDRTGLAMITIAVADMAAARVNAVAAGIALPGAGPLPLIDGQQHDGFYVRGAVGELIEVIGAND
jgi:catechol 2,3-dioxygenase-like lactoylglutathione lyase family enzyme